MTAEERLGSIVGRKLRLDRVIGEGGMGVVCEATNIATGRKVAVKLLHTELLRSLPVVERFMDEARAAVAVRHPNIVDVLDLDTTDDGVPYIVMELLRGETLRARLTRCGAMEPSTAWHALGPAMDAIAAAHEARIVHRDIKPDNLFLHDRGDGTEQMKVLDFGIAKLESARRTATGALLGTAHYMSPEQARGQDVGPWSDVWSMGVVWFETLTGRLPFRFPPGASSASVLAHIIATSPDTLATAAPAVPVDVAEAVDRALQPARKDRPADMQAFARALEQAFGERVEVRGVSARRVPRTVPMLGAAPGMARPLAESATSWTRLALGLGIIGIIGCIVSGFGITCVSCAALVSEAGGAGSADPSSLSATCTRSQCDFTNGGPGAGSMCVAVVLQRTDGPHVVSDDCCSGRVAAHATSSCVPDFGGATCALCLPTFIVPTPGRRVRFREECSHFRYRGGAGRTGATRTHQDYEVIGVGPDGWLFIDVEDESRWTRCALE